MSKPRMIGTVSLAAVLAVAGCSAKPTAAARTATPGASASTSASASTPTPSASASSSTTGTHRVQRCHTSDLTGHVEGHGEGAAQRYAVLGLTNKTTRSCTIYGYPGLQLVDVSGRNRQTTTHWDRSSRPTRLVVRPGQTVWALLHWTVIPADDEAANNCAPDPAALRVIPPDETTQLSMAFGAGRLCQHGSITVGAFGRDRPADG